MNKENNIFSDYPDVVSVDEMCKMLHICRNKGYELLHSNAIQSIRIGNKHIIPKVRVIEFLLKQS